MGHFNAPMKTNRDSALSDTGCLCKPGHSVLLSICTQLSCLPGISEAQRVQVSYSVTPKFDWFEEKFVGLNEMSLGFEESLVKWQFWKLSFCTTARRQDPYETALFKSLLFRMTTYEKFI